MKTLFVSDVLTLRELTRNDASDIFHTIDTQRCHLGRWLPFVEFTHELGDSERFVESTLGAQPYEFVFTLRDKDRFIGLAGFKATDRITRTTEIGYWMREEYQRRGIMTEAVQALCRFAFEELGMEQIGIKCATGNRRSNRIPQRLGFRLSRIESHGEQLTGGEWIDLNVYTADRQDFLMGIRQTPSK